MATLPQRAGWRVTALTAAILIGQGAMAAPSALPKQAAPIPTNTLALMRVKDTAPAAPILIRTYKKEAELEVWKKARSGQYVLLKVFPICRWSGQLGPKTREGDRQAPEGFYSVSPAQMNPHSAHYLSFDTGFPNAYDRAHGATGSSLMVHGTCSSAGCYAMTDQGIREIYAIAREAFAGGQRAFQFQAYPFRMTAENMVKYRSDPNIVFWRQLKEGSDRFEAIGQVPVVSVSAGQYVFQPAKEPDKEAQVMAHRSQEDDRIVSLTAEGWAAVRTTYADGGQHSSFLALARRGVSLGEVSRPEALAFAGREVVITPARPQMQACAAQGACLPQAVKATKAITPAVGKWPAAAALASIQSSLPALTGEPDLFASAPLSDGSMHGSALEFMISGSMRIVPARLTEMTPVTFAPL